MEISIVIEELMLFSERIMQLNPPANSRAIIDFERQFNVKFPVGYVEFLNRFIEHQEVANPMFDHLIPFSPDGYGSHYCFDIRILNKNICNVVFWQHDYIYSEADQPEITNISFAEWMKEMVIDGVLEDYDYNGNEK